MLRAQLRSGVAQVGLALREPEEFTRRWHGGDALYPWWVFLALALTAILGTTTYGLTMGLLGGPGTILLDAVLLHDGRRAGVGNRPAFALHLQQPLGLAAAAEHDAAGCPGDDELGRTGDDRVDPDQLVLHRLAPDLVANPSRVTWLVRAVNLVVFTGVGISMTDIFGRVMEVLEPERGRWPVLWLAVVSAIGGELFYAFGLFQFAFGN